MIVVAGMLALLGAPALAQESSKRWSEVEARPGRHPGQNGKLSAEQRAMAATAYPITAPQSWPIR